jgi:hypothetical protein
MSYGFFYCTCVNVLLYMHVKNHVHPSVKLHETQNPPSNSVDTTCTGFYPNQTNVDNAVNPSLNSFNTMWLFNAPCFSELEFSQRQFVCIIIRYFLGSKGGRYVGLTALSPSRVDYLEILEVSNSCSPKSLCRPVTG